MIIKYATVTSVTPLRVRFTSETAASETDYVRLSSYVPALNDRVAVLQDSNNKYIILGGVS